MTSEGHPGSEPDNANPEPFGHGPLPNPSDPAGTAPPDPLAFYGSPPPPAGPVTRSSPPPGVNPPGPVSPGGTGTVPPAGNWVRGTASVPGGSPAADKPPGAPGVGEAPPPLERRVVPEPPPMPDRPLAEQSPDRPLPPEQPFSSERPFSPERPFAPEQFMSARPSTDRPPIPESSLFNPPPERAARQGRHAAQSAEPDGPPAASSSFRMPEAPPTFEYSGAPPASSPEPPGSEPSAPEPFSF